MIHTVNGTPVDAVESLRAHLETIPDGAPIVLQIERAGMLSYVTPDALQVAAQRPKRTATAQSQPAPALRF